MLLQKRPSLEVPYIVYMFGSTAFAGIVTVVATILLAFSSLFWAIIIFACMIISTNFCCFCAIVVYSYYAEVCDM